MPHSFLSNLFISLGLTLILELAFALLWGLRKKDSLWLLILINTTTNPPAVLLNLLLARHLGLSDVSSALLIETVVVLSEWLLLKYNTKAVSRPFLFSLLANLFSYFSGLALLYFC